MHLEERRRRGQDKKDDRELEVFTISGGDVQALPAPLGPLRSPLLSITLERVVTPDGSRLVLVDGGARYALCCKGAALARATTTC